MHMQVWVPSRNENEAGWIMVLNDSLRKDFWASVPWIIDHFWLFQDFRRCSPESTSTTCTTLVPSFLTTMITVEHYKTIEISRKEIKTAKQTSFFWLNQASGSRCEGLRKRASIFASDFRLATFLRSREKCQTKICLCKGENLKRFAGPFFCLQNWLTLGVFAWNAKYPLLFTGDHVIPLLLAQCGECAFCKNSRTNFCVR